MGIRSAWRGFVDRPQRLEARQSGGGSGITLAQAIYGENSSGTGISVNYNSAMGIPAFSAAIRIISDSVASLPVMVVDENGEEVKHRVADFWNEEPNPFISAYAFRKAMMVQLLVYGNAFFVIDRMGDGTPTSLRALDYQSLVALYVGRSYYINQSDGGYDILLPDNPDEQLMYQFTTRNATAIWAGYEVLHIRGESRSGLMGLNPIRQFRETLGLALGAREYAADTFANGGVPVVLIRSDMGTPDATDAEAFYANYRRYVGQRGKRRNPLLVPRGYSVDFVNTRLEDTTFLESRQFDIPEISRMFNIPPSKLGDNTHSTYNNIAEQSLSYAQDCIEPLTRVIESEVNRKLLAGTGYKLKHDTSNLVRESNLRRNQALTIAVSGGFMEKYEARELIGLPAVPEVPDGWEVEETKPQMEGNEEVEE